MMAATLANGGVNPVTKKRMLDAQHVPQVLAVMATAGLYDDSGQWLFNTGLPAKSGVGGGLIAVSPGNFGVAVVSPPLDKAGNSVRAQKAIEYISSVLNGNPLAAGGEPMSASGRRERATTTPSRWYSVRGTEIGILAPGMLGGISIGQANGRTRYQYLVRSTAVCSSDRETSAPSGDQYASPSTRYLVLPTGSGRYADARRGAGMAFVV
jgi:hypothetical protein